MSRLALVILSVSLLMLAARPAGAAEMPSPPRSGFDDMSRDSQAMQQDDTANPGMLWVLDGESLWAEKSGSGRSCADCHGDARSSMKGVSARYPTYDAELGRPVDLDERINLCRKTRQNATPFERESQELLALAAYIGLQSRGMPIAPDPDPRLAPFRARGEALYRQRQGQLNVSCAQCHDDRWGRHLGSAVIPQGHPNGYPLYRLEWQSLGSLQRRFRNCLTGVRAEPYHFGSPEYVELELYLKSRAEGLPIETPAVRP